MSIQNIELSTELKSLLVRQALKRLAYLFYFDDGECCYLGFSQEENLYYIGLNTIEYSYGDEGSALYRAKLDGNTWSAVTLMWYNSESSFYRVPDKGTNNLELLDPP